jgi:hypothetical protein
MKRYIAIGLLFFIACGKQDPNDQIQYVNGYWEIDKVIVADGTEKQFSISTTIDFINVSENKGVRKKVNPKLDGTFTTSKDAETFTIKIEDDSLRLYYTTPFDTWKETVLKAKDSSLVVLNPDGNTYFYKRFKKFDFN